MTAVLETDIALEKTALERYVPPAKPSLVGLSRAQLADALGAAGVPETQRKMRVQQLWNWLYVRGVTDLDAMTSVSKELRAVLKQHFTLARPDVVTEQARELNNPPHTPLEVAQVLSTSVPKFGKAIIASGLLV